MAQTTDEGNTPLAELPSPLQTALSIPTAVRQEYQRCLIDWFRDNGRDFPWRQAADPYHILVSELLLQKTDSRTVGQVYLEFISRFPTPAHVSEAPLEEIQQVITPLGLLYRAERLKETCSVIVNKYGGRVPSAMADLLALKGVGRYAASAVLLFAFGEPAALVDRNVIRVLGRVFEIQSAAPRPHTDLKLWQAAKILVPDREAREYNLAVLDLSALICRPKPRCQSCPINHLCMYYAAAGGTE